MISVSQNWKERMGCYLMPNRERLAPEQLIKLEYNIDDETLIFDKSNITSFTHKQSCDLNSLTLPKNEIQFEIDNSDGRWNPDSPTGMYQKITEKQRVDLYYGVNGILYTDNVLVDTPSFYTIGSDTNIVDRAMQVSDITKRQARYGYEFFDTSVEIDDVQYNKPLAPGTYVVGYYLTIDGDYEYDDSASQHRAYLYWAGADETGSTLYPDERIQHYDNYDSSCSQKVFMWKTLVNHIKDYYHMSFRWQGSSLPNTKLHPFIVPWNKTIEEFTDEYVLLSGLGPEWHKVGTFYMSGWDTPQNGLTATFTATSQLDFGKDKFGEVTYATAPTMFDVCFSALVHMGMDPNHTSDFAKLDNILRNYSVPYKSGTTYTVDMFKNSTDAAVIQLCANAAMCRIRYNTAGKIYVEPMTLTGVELGDYTIDPFVSYRNAEYTMSKPIKNVLINNNLTVAIAEQGENQQISNNLITTQLHANQFGGWLADVINTRKEVNGEYRGDPRLQLYDYIKIINKYAVNEAFITAITYTFNGSFKGTYEGRVMKSISSADLYGNYYAGDHNKANSTIS